MFAVEGMNRSPKTKFDDSRSCLTSCFISGERFSIPRFLNASLICKRIYFHSSINKINDKYRQRSMTIRLDHNLWIEI